MINARKLDGFVILEHAEAVYLSIRQCMDASLDGLSLENSTLPGLSERHIKEIAHIVEKPAVQSQ